MGEDGKNIDGLNLSGHGIDTKRIVIPKGEPSTLAPTDDAGIPFWNKLSPDKQAILEGPIRKIEESIARQFPEGYVSPLVGRSADLRSQLEEQTDSTSCTYVASANALRVLDQPRVEYSRDSLKTTIDRIRGTSLTTIGATDLKAIFASGDPYNQFELQEYERPRLRIPQTSPEMMQLFRALQSGDIAVAAWRMSAEVAASGSAGFIEHARTIAGFSRGPNNTVLLHVIDPFGARQETWSFRDWVVASRMNMYFDYPLYGIEDIQKVTDNLNKSGGVMSAVANDVMVIHKNRPRLVITR